MNEYGAERVKITDVINVAYKVQLSLEKVKYCIDGHGVYGEQSRRNVENISSVERYLRDMQKIGFDKLLILSLFSAHIYERDDFENPEKLLRLKDNLEQAGYLANLSLDQELNLYILSVADKDKRRNEAIVDYEFCRQEDYRRYYRIYDRIAAYYEHEVRVDKEDLLRCSAAQIAFCKSKMEARTNGTALQRAWRNESGAVMDHNEGPDAPEAGQGR